MRCDTTMIHSKIIEMLSIVKIIRTCHYDDDSCMFYTMIYVYTTLHNCCLFGIHLVNNYIVDNILYNTWFDILDRVHIHNRPTGNSVRDGSVI